jgi:hypothetical protein
MYENAIAETGRILSGLCSGPVPCAVVVLLGAGSVFGLVKYVVAPSVFEQIPPRTKTARVPTPCLVAHLLEAPIEDTIH